MEGILREFQSFNGVGAGQTANINLVAGGPVYSAFIIKYSHTASTLATKAIFSTDIENIKIKLGGEVLWNISGANLVFLNDYYGYPMVDGYFPIMFARPEFLDALEQRRFALGTAGVRSLTVEIKVKAGTVAPELSMFGELYFGQQRPPGQLIRVRSTAQSAQAAGGVREIHDLPLVDPYRNDPGRGLKALHIKSGVITDHQILLNDDIVTEGPAALVNLVADIKSFQTISRTPQAGFHHVDFTGNRYSGIVPMSGVNDFRLKLTFSGAAAAFDLIAEEVIGTPDI